MITRDEINEDYCAALRSILKLRQSMASFADRVGFTDVAFDLCSVDQLLKFADLAWRSAGVEEKQP